MIDVLLIHPPNRLDVDLCLNSALPVEVVGYGLLHIAAFLETEGYSVRVIDVPGLFAQNFTTEEVLSFIRSYDPELIGIELNWLHFSRGAIEMAQELKKSNPNIPIVLGGTHASLFKEEILYSYSPWIDEVIQGEGESSLLSMLEGASPQTECLEIDRIPPYDPSVIIPKREGRTMFLNTCRGSCCNPCMYCLGNSIHEFTGRTTLTRHSTDWVAEQLQLFIEGGYTDIGLQDPWTSGTGVDTYVEELATMFDREGFSDQLTRFNLECLPGALNGEQLHILAEMGVTDIDYGCESGSDKVLSIVNRPVTTQKMIDSIEKTAAQGIIPITYWMTGFPRETSADISLTTRTIRRIAKVGGIPHWITPIVITPGTPLYKKRKSLGIQQRLHTFEDFSIYSQVKKKQWAWYPELISHSTEEQSVEEILMSSITLKLASLECRDIILKAIKPLEKMFYNRHPDWEVENRIFRSIDYALKSMKGTYF
ncbi:MAG: B12-binding domain-containing radical SAM protein [Theionarchaea archaeon]|nr:B12-binding domain-containing radical SAM protein [Theionarchaea archaeon]